MPKIAEVKLSSCGLKVADFRKNCDSGIAELRLRINITLKSGGIAIVEVLPSSCGMAIADSNKSCACPALVIFLSRRQKVSKVEKDSDFTYLMFCCVTF
jgi:hypothetical protein